MQLTVNEIAILPIQKGLSSSAATAIAGTAAAATGLQPTSFTSQSATSDESAINHRSLSTLNRL